jgi:signal peptidase II
VIPNVLSFTYVPNTHGAMGLFGDRPALLILMASGVIVLLGFLLRNAVRRSVLAQIGFGLILGGAIGNVVDRYTHHFVVDFISFRNFYIFNAADACITAGVVLLVLSAMRTPAPA